MNLKKSINLILLFVLIISFTGCIEILQELTVKEDGTGSFCTITEFVHQPSSVPASMADADADKEKLKRESFDTTYVLSASNQMIGDVAISDGLDISNARLRLKSDKINGFSGISFTHDFENIENVGAYSSESRKLIEGIVYPEVINKRKADEQDLLFAAWFEEYFIVKYYSGKFSWRVNQSNIKEAANNELFRKIIQANGGNLRFTFKIYLPAEALNVTGQCAELSEDRKTIVVSTDLKKFMENPSCLEFEAEY